jgi:EmrB/QacA subfamily drug resistance transporter
VSKSPVVHVEENRERSHEEIMIIIVALMLAMLLAALDQTIVATALPKIATDLNGLSKLSWVATAYLLTSAVSTPLYGKISDQFGRKKIFQFAIIIFLIGSVLCGQARNMNQLVAFRALQGLGAGGLLSLSMTIVGDIVSPRQRGKYLAYFGAVFAFSSVAGPLLGGFLTDSLSWRWVFYVNIPIGIVALAAIGSRLHLPIRKTDKVIDYVGAVLMTAAVVPIILATVWGGVTYPWTSVTTLGLFAGGIVAAIAFVLWERKVGEDAILPMHMFKNEIFSISMILSLLAGIALFAAILFIPEYQQIVRGYSPVKSGLLLLPLVGGMLASLITSGRLITKYGHYRPFPIIGTLITAFGVWLFSHLSLNTSHLTLSIWMVVIGIGIGSFLQVMTLAVQNAMPRSELGVATGAATFFRSMGSSLGGAIFGAILTNRLVVHLKQLLPHNTGNIPLNLTAIQNGASNSYIHSLPPSVSHDILQAFVLSFSDMFLIAVPVILIAFVASLFLKEKPLRTTTAAPEAI